VVNRIFALIACRLRQVYIERRIEQANGFEFGLNSTLAEGIRVFVGFVGFVEWG
jgi:hypothetical protein